jgi:peptidoglycan/LPS O-acetylase OafA/YrhL
MRIWPLMAVQIVVTTILLSALATDNPISVEISDNLSDYLQSLLGLLTFTNVTNSNYLLSRSVLWTLQAEFWFYVTMALLALIGGRHAVFWFAFVGVGLAWFAKLGIVQFPLALPMRFALIYFDQLMIGVLCAFAIRSRGRLLHTLFSNRALCLWSPFAAVVALSTLTFRGFDLPWYLASSASAYLTAVVIIHQSVRPLKGDYEPIATLGRISYSLYLMHAVVFEFMNHRIFPYELQSLFEIGVTIVVSMATYRWVEQPFVRWSKRVAEYDYTSSNFAKVPTAILG